MQWAFAVGAVLSVAVLVLAFLLPGRTAAPVHPVEPGAEMRSSRPPDPSYFPMPSCLFPRVFG